jgi:hypothetical protein
MEAGVRSKKVVGLGATNTFPFSVRQFTNKAFSGKSSHT